MEVRIAALARIIFAWMAYSRIADTPQVFRDLDECLRRRMRQADGKNGNATRLDEGTSARSACPNPTPANGRQAGIALNLLWMRFLDSFLPLWVATVLWAPLAVWIQRRV